MDSLEKLAATIDNLYFGLPLLLNLRFADPPYVERISGRAGEVAFRWELSEWRFDFRPTTQDEQEVRAVQAFRRMGVLTAPSRRRLIAALHHFHLACRLARAGETAGEFMAEVVLNLSKTLEVLFPPGGDGRTPDAVRAGLRGLGFDDAQIERDYLPAMALRNEIDVGHVELGLFKRAHLAAIHAFTERAEATFRDMLERLMTRIEAGTFDVEPYTVGPARPEALALVERLRQSEP